MDIELVIAAIMTLAGIGLGVAGIWLLPQQIPLWYSYALPEQQLVPKLFFLTLPISMVVITILHVVIITKLRKLDHVLSQLFTGASVLVLFIHLVAMVHILFLFL